MKIGRGDYYLMMNIMSGTVIDLSINDLQNVTVSGWSQNNGKNQRWQMIETGVDGNSDNQIFKYCASKTLPASCLGTSNSNPKAGDAVFPSDTSQGLVLQAVSVDGLKDLDVYQIFVQNRDTGLILEMTNGNGANGTTLQLNNNFESLHQLWKFSKP